MIESQYEEVSLDFCEACGGVWVNHGELSRVIESRERTFSLTQVAQALSTRTAARGERSCCPKCEKPLEEFNYAQTGIQVDRCPDRHGLFLDPGELDRIQLLVEEGDRRFLGTAQKADPLPGSPRKCPTCAILLDRSSYERVDIDLCAQCGGVWLDQGELSAIITRRERKQSPAGRNGVRSASESSAGPDLKCPLCPATMNRFDYAYGSGVTIDSCPADHGVWLERGELEKIQQIIESGEKERYKDMSEWKTPLTIIAAKSQERYRKNARIPAPASRYRLVHVLLQDLVASGAVSVE